MATIADVADRKLPLQEIRLFTADRALLLGISLPWIWNLRSLHHPLAAEQSHVLR